jgi:putative flippase GtrA
MKQGLYNAGKFLYPIIDFFYPPFKKLMPLKTFRYAASGAGNTFLGLLSYYITYKFILQKNDFHFGFYAFKSHIAALFVSFCVSFFVGFFLMKYVVFNDSNMKGRVQMFRYFMVSLFNLLLNYLLLKITVELWHIYPVIAQIATTLVIIVFSYLAQRHFAFKKISDPIYIENDEG